MPTASTFGPNQGSQMREPPIGAKETIRQGAGDMLDSLKDVGETVKHQAQEGFESLRETTADYVEQGRARAQDLGESMEKQIRAQPLTAVLVAVGVGFLVGAIWSRT